MTPFTAVSNTTVFCQSQSRSSDGNRGVDCSSIANDIVSSNLQGYLVNGAKPYVLTPISGSPHLFTVQSTQSGGAYPR